MKRVERCVGWTLWAGERLRIELWICLANVSEHRHPDQEVEVLPLWGWARFWRSNEDKTAGLGIEIGPQWWARQWLTIPAGWWHGFELERGPLVFVNRTFDGRSAADNFNHG